MSFCETNAVNSHNHTKPMNKFCQQNEELLTFKAADAENLM